MSGLHRYSAVIGLAAAISLLTVSCGESKITQCQKIGQITKEVAIETKNLTNDGKTKDRKAILKAADAAEKAAKDMAALKIRDKKLQELQTGFSKMYRDMSKSTRDIVIALNKKDFPAVDAGLKNWQQAYNSENNLVKGINSYCTNQ